MKRVFDVLLSLATLVALLPLLALAAMAIRLGDGGPIFYAQTRVGRGGRHFRMLKFRSMSTDADKVGGYVTADGDPRITPAGRVLRRTSVDELPQLINVLRGEMSLVGPRPDVPAQRSLYSDEEWQLRHRVRPGITGLAQATSRSLATPEERKRLDLLYAEQASLLFDLRIIGSTFRQLIRKGGN